jgi:DNA-binding NarL/FixJ family response regulator
MPKVLVVDDVSALRQHAIGILQSVLPAVEIIEAQNGAQALTLWAEQKPDMIIMDIVMPEMNGIKAAQQIWAESPRTKILFWSQFHRESYVRELGKIVPDETIHGYALKGESDTNLSYAIQSLLLHDNPYIDPLVRGIQHKIQNTDGLINESEYGILLDIVLGLTDKAIAMREHISVRGAQNKISSLSQKLLKGADEHLRESAGMDVYNIRVRITLEAFRRGLIDPEDIDAIDEELDGWLARKFNFEKS